MDSIGVAVAHDDDAVLRAVGEAIDASAGLYVAGTGTGSHGQVLVAGGEPLQTLDAAPVPVVALADRHLVRAARAALAVGARDIVRWPAESARLAEAIRTALRPPPARDASVVVSVAGARGGLGASTVVAALAARWDAIALDLTGGLAMFIDDEPRRTLADVATPSIGPESLEGALVPLPGGGRILHAGSRVPDAGLLHVVVRAARALSPVVVLDGRWERADRHVLLVGDDVASVRAARGMLDPMPALVLRRMRRRGLRARDVRDALDAEPVAVVATEPAVARAADLGRLPRRSRAFDALAEALGVTGG